MKKYSQYLLAGLCVVSIAFSAGAFMEVQAATEAAPVVSQPVDLTYAAEKAVPAVVHIKYVRNSKTQTVDVQGDDFFTDPFSFFFGNPN